MRRLLVFFFITIATAVSAQTAPRDSQTLQALLAEVRQMHHDLLAQTAMAQRVQIALYRLQREDEAVARATQRVNDARAEVSNAEAGKNRMTAEIQKTQATINNSQNPGEAEHFENVVIPMLKSQLEIFGKQEQQAQAHESEAENQLRDEQDKLDSLNDLLERLNTALEQNSGSK